MPSFVRDETTLAELLQAMGLEYRPAPGRKPPPPDALVWLSLTDWSRNYVEAAVRLVESPDQYATRRNGADVPRIRIVLAAGYVEHAAFCPGCGETLRFRRDLMQAPNLTRET